MVSSLNAKKVILNTRFKILGFQKYHVLFSTITRNDMHDFFNAGFPKSKRVGIVCFNY